MSWCGLCYGDMLGKDGFSHSSCTTRLFHVRHQKVDVLVLLCVFGWNQSAPALLLHASTLLFLAQSECTSAESGQLFHQYCRPLVATAEVLERCKVQRGSVWSGLGDPSHVSLLMLSQGEADTQPTGVTVPPPKPLSHRENGADTRDLLVSFSPAYPLCLWFADLFCNVL